MHMYSVLIRRSTADQFFFLCFLCHEYGAVLLLLAPEASRVQVPARPTLGVRQPSPGSGTAVWVRPTPRANLKYA